MEPTRNTSERLAHRLGLPPPDPYSQDWEYEVADPTKVGAWLAVYGADLLPPDEQILLMKMILESYNDLVSNGSPQPEVEDEIRRYLIRDSILHAPTIDYWALPGEVDLDDCFAVTPMIRAVKQAVDEGGHRS